jgi:hypothetical protein
VGQVRRDGLDACIYKNQATPTDKAPPSVSKPKVVPGAEYETTNPPPPVAAPTIDKPSAAPVPETLSDNTTQAAPAGQPPAPPVAPPETQTAPPPADPAP